MHCPITCVKVQLPSIHSLLWTPICSCRSNEFMAPIILPNILILIDNSYLSHVFHSIGISSVPQVLWYSLKHFGQFLAIFFTFLDRFHLFISKCCLFYIPSIAFCKLNISLWINLYMSFVRENSAINDKVFFRRNLIRGYYFLHKSFHNTINIAVFRVSLPTTSHVIACHSCLLVVCYRNVPSLPIWQHPP